MKYFTNVYYRMVNFWEIAHISKINWIQRQRIIILNIYSVQFSQISTSWFIVGDKRQISYGSINETNLFVCHFKVSSHFPLVCVSVKHRTVIYNAISARRVQKTGQQIERPKFPINENQLISSNELAMGM